MGPDGPTEAQRFYDEFVDHQLTIGVNERHHSIMRHLKRAGLEPRHRILEIGCGVGTLTGLLAEHISRDGSLLATDLSPKSVEVARASLARFANVDLRAGDILEMEIDGTFDVIVLPDVIEHIPLEQHPQLFGRIAGWLREGGFALMNYPNPNFLEWCREHKPEELQVIDQPVYTDVLTANAYPHGLYLDFLETYSIWVHEGDYQVAVLRRRADATDFTEIPWRPPFRQKLREALALRARRLLGRTRA
jgi:cyclopropane fatty-acyl-phospholipid synthase-like methyltransferase